MCTKEIKSSTRKNAQRIWRWKDKTRPKIHQNKVVKTYKIGKSEIIRRVMRTEELIKNYKNGN